MNNSLSKPLLSALSGFTVTHMGLQFVGAREKDLERGIKSIAEKMGFSGPDACAEWLLNKPLTTEQIEVLASYLTIGETYFFRDARYFELLEHKLLLERIQTEQYQTKRLRIWSAGCSTGEEAYTIAMLISRLIPHWREWQITVLATDINVQALAYLGQGVYREWSFRDVPAAIKTEYFDRDNEANYHIKPHLKEMVTSNYLNLATDTYPSVDNNTNAMDVIFCRNVLMYFAPEQAAKVVRQLAHCLVPGGWLIVSPCECGQPYFNEMQSVQFPTETGANATVYQKLTEQQIADKLLEQKTLSHPIKPFIKQRQVTDFEVKSQSTNKSPISNHVVYPADSATDYQRAQQYYQEGLYKHAILAIEQTTSPATGSIENMELLARSYANLGQLDVALVWIHHAVKKDKTNVKLLYLHALILTELSHYDKAMTAFKEILYLDHSFILAHFNLGHIALHFGLKKEANKYFCNAMKLASHYGIEEVIPESEGLTVGRLLEVIELQQKQLDQKIKGGAPWK